MGCSDCGKTKIPCGNKCTGCQVKDLSTDCIIYPYDDLVCGGIEGNKILTDVIKELSDLICNKFDNVTGYGSIINIGTGIGLYKQVNQLGQKELKSLTSSDGSITITSNDNEVDLSVDIPNVPEQTDVVSVGIDGNPIYLGENISNEDEISSLVDLTSDAKAISVYKQYNASSKNHEFRGLIAGNRTTLSLDEEDQIEITVDEQVKANVIESNSNSAAFIQNKLPSKTVASDYTLQPSDNLHVIVVDTVNGDVNITYDNSIGVPKFFVGFIQKNRLGVVNFIGNDVTPLDFIPTIYGEGHNAAIEVIDNTCFLFGSLKKV